MSKKKRAEKTLIYLNEQVKRFLWYEYRIKRSVPVYGHKTIEKQGKYAQVIMDKGKPVGIDVSYKLVMKGQRETLLKVTLREAVKVAFWYMRKPYSEGSKEYNQELLKKGLPVYGTVSQTGKELHTYGCSECKKIYFLKEKKLPKSKDPSEQVFYTPCCEQRFSYEGKIFYDNNQLQKIVRQMKK